MRELVVLLEEPSARELLKIIVSKLFPDISLVCMVFEGKQDLEKNITRKLRGYLNHDARFLVIRDQDSGDCKTVKQWIEQQCIASGKTNYKIRIMCHELETIYLADLQAVEKGLGLRAVTALQEKNPYRCPDELSNPKQKLKELAAKHKGTYHDIAGSRAIAPHLDLSNVRSLTFRNLIAAVKELAAEHKNNTEGKKTMVKLCSFSEFDKVIKNKRLFLIGAGKRSVTLLQKYTWNVFSCIDNDESKNGTFLHVSNTQIPVHNWNYLLDNISANGILLVTPVAFESLLEKIESEAALCDIDCYIASYMHSLQWDFDRIEASKVPYEITKGTTPKIPKIIHYFWFSGDPYPEKVQKCIDSWHKFCPDYEFKKWDLTNYKTDCKYANMALSQHFWALASDYGRCDVVHRYGGIYLDSDVELVKPLDDLLYDKGFFCFESAFGVDPGSGFGAEKGNPIIREICVSYEKLERNYVCKEDPNGNLDRVNILTQYTNVLSSHGLKNTGQYQNIEGIAVYPPLVLSPYSYATGILTMDDKTYGIHHWVSNWITDKQMNEMNKRKAFIKNCLPDGINV